MPAKITVERPRELERALEGAATKEIADLLTVQPVSLGARVKENPRIEGSDGKTVVYAIEGNVRKEDVDDAVKSAVNKAMGLKGLRFRI